MSDRVVGRDAAGGDRCCSCYECAVRLAQHSNTLSYHRIIFFLSHCELNKIYYLRFELQNIYYIFYCGLYHGVRTKTSEQLNLHHLKI
jgi:hypothetical protein